MGVVPRLPNFFLLGAGRSGTTSLYQHLARHPQVFMSPNKEPTFFCDFFGMQNPWDYVQLFQAASNEPVVGECSHAYLSCATSAAMLRAYTPQAKFVVVFRNPAVRAYSLYSWMTAVGNEWLFPFERALEAEERRINNPRFFRRNPQYFYNYLYFRSGLYGQQIARYAKLFPRSQFLFLRFEELAGNMRGVLARIFRFLGVDPEFYPGDLPPANASRRVRSTRLQFWLRRRLEPVLVKLRLYRLRPTVDRVAAWNVLDQRPAPLAPATKARLLERYREDLELLERLTGIDTSAWRGNGRCSASGRGTWGSALPHQSGSGPYRLKW